jgi:cellulose synthase/poly-beta-1,6-N-acetylglucosamine synthase-like glycosyltransferase
VAQLTTLDLIVAFTWITFAIPVAVFCFYGVLVIYYSRKKLGVPRATCKSSCEPAVSIVIPTHNEREVIGARIENLLSLDYPREKMEVVFVDDSDDSTPEMIEGYAQANSFIHLIRFSKRMGYTRSVLAGCKASQGEIIILAETGAMMSQDTVRRLVENFSDPSIGVVTGQDLILNADEIVGRSEQWYQRIYNLVRTAESNMDSTFYIKGEAAAFRGNLIRDSSELEKCPADTGTADTAIALVARKYGLRAIYDSRVKFSEYAPSTHIERVRQKVNRGANLIRILWHFRTMFFSRKYGKFGTIILPVNFMLLAIVPVMILIGIVAFAAISLSNPSVYLPVWLLAAGIIILAAAINKPAVVTILEFEYCLIKGLFEIVFLRKDHDKLEKIASTRRFAT